MSKQVLIITWLISLIVHLSLNSVAEVKIIGNPHVKNYDNSMNQAGTQTWMIDIGTNGLMYFANNDGVLEFDGVSWRKFPLAGRTVVRSVKAASDGRIYAGGYDEFGYFQPDRSGNLVFSPLQSLLPENKRNFGDVWKIYEWNESIIFQAFNQLMIYRNDTIHIIEAPDMFHFSFLVNGYLYVNDQSKGLFQLINNRLIKSTGTEKLNGKLIWSIIPVGNTLLLATANDGIFKYHNNRLSEWKNQTSDLLQQKQVFCGQALDNSTLAFGTIQDGLIICDTAGSLIQHMNIDKGLQNNTVLSLQIDNSDNLWLGLDNGIDYVEINSPLTFFSTYNNLSSCYAAVIHNNLIYFGTNQGVFYSSWDELLKGGTNQKFSLVSGTQGQVWSLEVIDGNLFCGHNSGVFIIDGKKADLLSDIQGGWTFIRPTGQENMVICGTYTFLVKFEKKNGQWSRGIPIKGFKESSKYLANAGQGSLWISHGYKGVYRTHFNTTYDSVIKTEFYNSRQGFPTDKDINVFEISNRPVFTTGRGIYRYDPINDHFVPDEFLTSRLTRTDMNILRKDSHGNLWYFTTDDVGVYRLKEDGYYTEVEIPFRELHGKFIRWFQFVYPFDDNHVFIGTQTGIAHYMPNYIKNYHKPFRTLIRSMKILAEGDSVLYNGTPSNDHFSTTLPYRYNHLQFEFAATDYENPERISYLTQLEGFDKDWIDWNNHTIRQFTNLSHGNYTFKVKSVNIFGVEGETAMVQFSINPPWYLSRFAYAGYSIGLILLTLALIRFIRYRLERSKKAFEEEQRQLFIEKEKQLQIESLIAEQEVIKLRNEKLQNEKIQKDKELANTTMQIIQKSRSLRNLKNDLRKLTYELGTHPAVSQINMITKKINRSIDSEKQWEVFENHFENVHEEFLKKLKENYPELTPRELKLCAYLRLNISSKEIAALMNISVRGVEISRYRLRKKLGIDHDTNLTDFILSF